MVATRGHPKEFPEAGASPSKSTRSRSRSPGKRTPRTSTSPAVSGRSPAKKQSRGTLVPELPGSSNGSSTSPNAPSRTTKRQSKSSWSHTPSILTLSWLAISLPLVMWDTGYVFLRPHTMPGGRFVRPFYTPYQLYHEVDYMYGAKAWTERNGFTAAQSALNVLETIAYMVYLYVVCAYSEGEAVKGRGAPSKRLVGRLAHSRTLHGRVAAWAVLIAFSSALMTVSKTLLYWLNEVFSDFANIGHNSAFRLFFLWIVPNGAWLVVPSYMVYVFGSEILQGLEAAAGMSSKKTQ